MLYRKQDFLKTLILRELVLLTSKDISKEYGISLFVVECFEELIHVGKPFGKMLTEYDVLELYLEGLTFREIGYLKGITKEGVRYIFDRLPIDKEDIKKEHNKRRKQLWEDVRGEMIRNAVEEKGLEKAVEDLGYSIRYLRLLLREDKKRGGPS